MESLTRRLPPGPPLPLERERTQHDGLGRALRTGTGGLPRRVEEVGEYSDAALLDLGGLRILGVIDEVPVQVLGDDSLGLGLHPGGNEGGQVPHREPVEDQLLADEAHGLHGGHPMLGQVFVGRRLE